VTPDLDPDDSQTPMGMPLSENTSGTQFSLRPDQSFHLHVYKNALSRNVEECLQKFLENLQKFL